MIPGVDIVWIDLETSGFKASQEQILEFGCVFTDMNLTPLWRFSSVVAKPSVAIDALVVRCDQEVFKMHTENGLFSEIKSGKGMTLSAIEQTVLRMIPEGRRPLCGGRSVHFDRSFLDVNMPVLNSKLMHRNVDVSAFFAVWKAWAGEFPQKKEGGHRVTTDLDNTLAEAAWYKSRLSSLGASRDMAEGINKILDIAKQYTPSEMNGAVTDLRTLANNNL
jgi:oligoribonuclease